MAADSDPLQALIRSRLDADTISLTRGCFPMRGVTIEPVGPTMTGEGGGFDYEAALAACATGDRAALRTLYEREARWLMGVATRIVRDRSMAEEVLQEAFLQIWRAAGTFDRSRGSGRGWIYTVVRHRALQELRRSTRAPEWVSLDVDQPAEAGASAGDHVPDRDAHELERCLEQLEPQRRACIVHAFVDGYTHEQIAAKVGAPIGTVKSWVRRGLLALRNCLS
jgi:RNA polymerase sigma-70 factor, ECF subfamily